MAIATPSDIAFAMSYCSQFLNKYEHKHCSMVKQYLEYIKGTLNFALYFASLVFSLVSWRHTVMQIMPVIQQAESQFLVLHLNTVEEPLDGKVVDRMCVSLSTTKAEYVAASEAAKEIVSIKRLVNISSLTPIPILQVDIASAFFWLEKDTSLY